MEPRLSSHQEVARYRSHLQGEFDGAATYRAMAELERQPQRAEVYRRLAPVEESHAGFWRRQRASLGALADALRPGWRTKVLIRIAMHFGASVVAPTLRTLEERIAITTTLSPNRARR